MAITEQDGSRIATALEGLTTAMSRMADVFEGNLKPLTEDEKEMARMQVDIEKRRLQAVIDNNYEEPNQVGDDTPEDLKQLEFEQRRKVLKNATYQETIHRLENEKWYHEYGRALEKEVAEKQALALKEEPDVQKTEGILFDITGGKV